MNSFAPIPTENKEWGFWGTSVGNGYDAELTWDTASRFLAKHFDLTAEQARSVLDNRFGRHLADDLSFIEGGPATAEAITNHLTRRINHDGWRKSFEDVIRTETGKIYQRKKPLSREDVFQTSPANISTSKRLKSENRTALIFTMSALSVSAAL